VRERDRIQLATVVNRLNGVVKARAEFVARDRSRDTGAAVAGQPRRLDVGVVCIGPDPAWKNAPAKYAVVIVVTWLMVGISLAYGVFDAVKAALQLLG
jgi:hypothetical protein